MAHATVCAAAEAWLRERWDHAAVPVCGRNGSGRPDGTPFVRLDFPWCRSEQVSVGAPGNNVWREEGAFRVILYCLRGLGTDLAAAWSSEVEAMFRGRSIAANIRCGAPVTASDDEDSDGNYFIVVVAIPYECDIFG